MFDAYAVSGSPPEKHRFHIGTYETEREARNRVRQAIASGFVYGYIKQGHEVVAYLTEASFTVKRIAQQAEADSTSDERGERVSRRPLFRVEDC